MRHSFLKLVRLTTLAVCMAVTPLWAEDASSPANAVFAEAVRVYIDSQSKDEATQNAAAQDVLRLFDLIVTGYPDSLPAQRIKAGGKVGPIDLDALKTLAGVEAEPAAPDVVTVAPSASASQDGVAAKSSEAVKDASLLDSVLSQIPGKDPIRMVPWFRTVVTGSSPEGAYSHGQFPSEGPRTHPGLDLVSACGTAVVSPWEGTVEWVVKAGSPDFPQLGNAVFVKYPLTPSDQSAGEGTDIHAAYLGLGTSPAAAVGDIVKQGQLLGVTGQLHDVGACGVHFEMRNFPATESGVFPLWHGALAVGDWRQDEDFLANWHDPDLWAPWFDGLHYPDEEDGVRIAGHEWVSFSRKKPTESKPKVAAFLGKTGTSLYLSSQFEITRKSDLVQIVLTKLTDSPNSGKSSILLGRKSGDDYTLILQAMQGGILVAEATGKVRLYSAANGYAALYDRVAISMPQSLLGSSVDRLQLTLLDSSGRSYSLGEALGDFSPLAVNSEDLTDAMLRDLRDLAIAVTNCLSWDLPDGVLLYSPVRVAKGRLEIRDTTTLKAEAETQEDAARAEILGRTLPSLLATCPDLNAAPESGTTVALDGFDLVLGWPVQ